MCSVAIECVVLLYNVATYDRMCPLQSIKMEKKILVERKYLQVKKNLYDKICVRKIYILDTHRKSSWSASIVRYVCVWCVCVCARALSLSLSHT